MDLTETRFAICNNGGNELIYSWNPGTMQATRLYFSNYGVPASGSLFFSCTQPYIAYDVEFTSDNNPAVYSYNYQSATLPATRQLIVDLATCVADLAGIRKPMEQRRYRKRR